MAVAVSGSVVVVVGEEEEREEEGEQPVADGLCAEDPTFVEEWLLEPRSVKGTTLAEGTRLGRQRVEDLRVGER